MNWGRGPITFHDWAFITAPRFTLLRNAITTGTLPLTASVPIPMGETVSPRIMAIPDLLLSPQILLLPFMSVSQFALFQVALMYAIGFLGLLRLRKKMKWAILTLAVVSLLFNFNGHIMSHIGVGHLTWGGYFLFSWFAVLIFEIFDRQPDWRWIGKMALVMFAILLQGSYHQFIWLLFFLGMLAVVKYKYFLKIVGAAVFSVLLGLMRLLPEISLLQKYDNKFIAGYPNLSSILRAMIIVDQPIFRTIESTNKKLGTWETSLFIGIAGIIFLAFFGLIMPWIKRNFQKNHYTLYLPILGIFLLSLNQVYKPLRAILPFPPLTGERVASRIIIVAFVFTLFLAANEFQRWIDRRRTSLLAIGTILSLSMVGVIELANYARQWRVIAASWYFPFTDFLESEWTISNNYSDTLYLSLVIAGLSVTIITAIFLSAMAWREAHAIQPMQREPRMPNALPLGKKPQTALVAKPIDNQKSHAPNIYLFKK